MSDDATAAGSAAGHRPPGVAVVMPVLNESRHLRAAVRAILAQDYTGPMEVVLALGPSGDDTDKIAAELAGSDPRIRLVENPTGATPCGLNAAIEASTHEVVVRVDGHSMLPPDYVRTAVEVLVESGADNVGGIMAAEGVTPFEQAVARAMCSRLGIGGSRFHLGGQAGPAETVYLGVFRREILQRVGGFDPTLRRAQDWELNHRIRKAGGVVWFTPRLQVTYRPRADLRALARPDTGPANGAAAWCAGCRRPPMPDTWPRRQWCSPWSAAPPWPSPGSASAGPPRPATPPLRSAAPR